MSTMTDASCGAIALRAGNTRVDLVCTGASIQRVFTPDNDGRCDDIVLGYDDESSYQTNPFYFGCIVGRVANRIKDGRFSLNSRTYQLETNNGTNHLHGGPAGLHTRVWTPTEVTDTSVTFVYLSLDGEEGYPGTVAFSVRYTLEAIAQDSSPGSSTRHPSFDMLKVEMRGHVLSDTISTPIALAGHTYWNLKGHDGGTILDHDLTLRNHVAFLELDDGQVPTGNFIMEPSMDFRTCKPIGDDIAAAPGGMGYDHCYATHELSTSNIDTRYKHWGDMVLNSNTADLRCSKTGRILRVWSDAPGLQLYTGNYLDGSAVGKGGCRYAKHGGVCLETQGYPNAINTQPSPSPPFPTSEVIFSGSSSSTSPNVYTHTMCYAFTTEKAEKEMETATVTERKPSGTACGV